MVPSLPQTGEIRKPSGLPAFTLLYAPLQVGSLGNKSCRSLCSAARKQTKLWRAVPRSLAQGFSPSSGEPTAPPGAAKSKESWGSKYKDYVKRNGELLCAMAWEGYERLGRGAVFANYDTSSSSMAVVDRSGKNVSTATPSFYVDRDQLVAKNEKDQLPQMKPILSRIASYDPQSQFVVVFEADGTQGADIVTPNQSPSDVWARTRKDGGKSFDWEKKK